MNLLEQIAEHLEFCGIGTANTNDAQGDIFWGLMPDTPDKCACIFSTDSGYGGSDNGARIQIMTRAKTTREAYELSQAIVYELAEFDGFLAGGGAHARIEIINASAGLGSDGKKRELYSSNFRVYYCND